MGHDADQPHAFKELLVTTLSLLLRPIPGLFLTFVGVGAVSAMAWVTGFLIEASIFPAGGSMPWGGRPLHKFCTFLLMPHFMVYRYVPIQTTLAAVFAHSLIIFLEAAIITAIMQAVIAISRSRLLN